MVAPSVDNSITLPTLSPNPSIEIVFPDKVIPATLAGSTKSALILPLVLTVSNSILRPNPSTSKVLSSERIGCNVAGGSIPDPNFSPGEITSAGSGTHAESLQVTAFITTPCDGIDPTGKTCASLKTLPSAKVIPSLNVWTAAVKSVLPSKWVCFSKFCVAANTCSGANIVPSS